MDVSGTLILYWLLAVSRPLGLSSEGSASSSSTSTGFLGPPLMRPPTSTLARILDFAAQFVHTPHLLMLATLGLGSTPWLLYLLTWSVPPRSDKT